MLQPVKVDTAYAEVVVVPNANSQALVIASAPHSTLLFQRERNSGEYTALLKTSISFTNTKGFNVCGKTIKDTVVRNEEYVEHLRTEDDSDTRITYGECVDEQTRSIKATVSSGEVSVKTEQQIDVNSIFSVVPVRQSGSSFLPLGKGGTLSFGKKSSLLVLTASNIRSYTLEISDSKGFSVFRQQVVPNTSIVVEAESFKLVNPSAADKELSASVLDDVQGVVVEIPTETLREGTYTVSLSQGIETQTQEIEVVWHNKPRTLVNKEVAIQLLELIVPEQEYERIEDGDQRKQFTAAMNWWALQDPTPGTPFNEAMNAFYTRADYALRTFRSHTKTGLRSDRGKVFMLYGEPSNVRQNLTGEVSQEVWEYTNQVDRVFTFAKNGSEYTLVSIKPNQQ